MPTKKRASTATPRSARPRKGKRAKARPHSGARKTLSKRPRLKVALPRARVGRKLSPGIVRLDYDRARGYIVRLSYRLTRTGWRPRFNRYFSDVKYGGKKQALTAAEAWLDIVTRTGRAPKEA